MRSKYIVLFIIMLLGTKLKAKSFDTASVILNAKMNLVKFTSGNLSASQLHTIIDAPCNYQFVQSKGFEDIVFFKIAIDVINPIDSFNKVVNIGWVVDTFYFGYNVINHDLYRMKGFLFNDFDRLYSFIRFYTYRRYLKSSKIFAEHFAIDGVDLRCLYLSDKKREKVFLKLRGYDCIKPAREIFTGAKCTKKDINHKRRKS